MSEIKEGIKYKTRCGFDIVIYTYNADGPYPVHGAYKNRGAWYIASWDKQGFIDATHNAPLDLIEVKLARKRKIWANIYNNNEFSFYPTRKQAEKNSRHDVLARVPVNISWSTGQGLGEGEAYDHA
jgi:hypothetical protein